MCKYLVLLPKILAIMHMSERSKLELEFEILTLTNNIETLKKLGKQTRDLKQRLDICNAKLFAIQISDEDGKLKEKCSSEN